MTDVQGCFVVVGGGIAGVSCAEQLSLLDPNRTTILLSASPLIKVATNIQSISKYLVRFDVEEQSTSVLTERCPGVRVLHDTVTDLLAEEQLLLTASGLRIHYEKLCVCSGARPNRAPAAQEHPSVLTVRDTESVRELQERLRGARRLLVVGNGGIATELVHEVRGVEIVWAVKNDHISAAFVDPGAAEFLLPAAMGKPEETPGASGNSAASAPVMKRLRYTETMSSGVSHTVGAALGPDWHERWDLCGQQQDRPLRVEYGCELRDILPGDGNWPAYVKLTNDSDSFGVDLVVSATGVIPNVEAFTKSNAEALILGEDGGILVDDHMRSSLPNVFAAGDACTAGWEQAQHWFQMRLWSQARLMGAYAGRCMFADRHAQPILQDFGFEMFAHVTRFFGHKVILLGLHNGQKLGTDYELLLRAVRGQEYVKLVIQNGRVQGAVLIGETNLEETCENLILDQLDVSHLGDDLLNPLVDVEDYFD